MLILVSAALFGFGLLLFSVGLLVMLLGLAIRMVIRLFQLGLLLVWAGIAVHHWLQQRSKLAVLLLLTGLLLATAPASARYDLPQAYLDAVADAATDYCVNHFCQQNTVPNWWTPTGKGTYWEQNAPTMADAPRWLKYPRKQQSWHYVGRVRRR